MSLRLEMLQVSRLATRQLDDASELVVDYALSQQHPSGGFCDRSGQPDLYYSVFGLATLRALQHELPVADMRPWLEGFGDGEALDLVHVACLARCWADLEPRGDWPRAAICERIEAYRSGCGGYSQSPGAEVGTVYASFMAFGAYQDCALEPPRAELLAGGIALHRAKDGGYANARDMPLGLTPSTTAAVALLRQLGQAPGAELGAWLLARHAPDGGFFATPMAPIPDLLSTATALHALAILKVDIDEVREPCLDFLDSLWSNRGAFYGTWQDEHQDLEYTWYALLALGHLSV